ncbi:MAG: hypothetical protein LBQ88_11525 [Treponema sp.]|jgi:hypothetical protein|nr:hypothetical protein [Treponema sp.]
MDDEKVLYEKNETLRIVGMYSFLFYLAACAVTVFVISKEISDWYAIIPWAIVTGLVIGFFVYAAIVLYKIKKAVREGKQFEVTIVEDKTVAGRYTCDVRAIDPPPQVTE